MCCNPGACIIEGHFPLGELGLGKFTPSKPDAVATLNSFFFDKIKDEW
jgi:hypothetical protein